MIQIDFRGGFFRLFLCIFSFFICCRLLDWNLGIPYNPFIGDSVFYYGVWEIIISCLCYVLVLWKRKINKQNSIIAFLFSSIIPVALNSLSIGLRMTEKSLVWLPVIIAPIGFSAIIYICFLLD